MSTYFMTLVCIEACIATFLHKNRCLTSILRRKKYINVRLRSIKETFIDIIYLSELCAERHLQLIIHDLFQA